MKAYMGLYFGQNFPLLQTFTEKRWKWHYVIFFLQTSLQSCGVKPERISDSLKHHFIAFMCYVIALCFVEEAHSRKCLNLPFVLYLR